MINIIIIILKWNNKQKNIGIYKLIYTTYIYLTYKKLKLIKTEKSDENISKDKKGN